MNMDGYTDGQCREILGAIETARALGFRDGEIEGRKHLEGEWVKVSERLPELNSVVLAFSKGYGLQKAVYEGDQWTVQSPDAYMEEAALTDVTHWRPLPPSPDEETR
jgi:hypothetical protein